MCECVHSHLSIRIVLYIHIYIDKHIYTDNHYFVMYNLFYISTFFVAVASGQVNTFYIDKDKFCRLRQLNDNY